MDPADAATAAALQQRLAEISVHEQGDPSRAALSGRELGR
jgi:hypothetical protein